MATVGRMACPDWLAAERLLASFGHRPSAARQAYARFVAQGLTTTSPLQEVTGQIFLGKKAFLGKMQKLAQTKPTRNVTRAHREPLRPTAEQVIAEIAAAKGLTRKQLLDRSHSEAFKQAVHALRRRANLSLNEVAVLAGISAPRVSQIQREIERDMHPTKSD